MTAEVPSSLVRPTVRTAFHIDYDWWDRADRDLEVYLRSHLCAEHQELFTEVEPHEMVDHIDPDTAEVTSIERIYDVLISHCARQSAYLTQQTSLVNAVFRVFLANGNHPLTPEEIADLTGRPARMILRTLSGPRVYKGIRPVQ
jgi:hypothetical protein